MANIPFTRLVLVKKLASDSEGYIKLKVTIAGTTKHKYKSTDKKISANFWDAKQEIVKKGFPKYDEINWQIKKDKAALVEAFESDLKGGVVFTENHIIKRLQQGELNQTADFYRFCREQIEIIDYAKNTRRIHKSEVNKMEGFSAKLSFVDINYSWLQKYEQYMRDTLENSDNTIWRSLKFLSTMMNQAIKIGGIISASPFKDYDRGSFEQGIPTYLEWSEIQLLHNALKTEPMAAKLRLIGYYGLLSCYSGLRFGDAVKFDYKSKVIEDATGKRLVLYAQKNGEIVSISFTKYIGEVVEYIKDKPLKISNQKFNVNVKSLAKIAEIDKDFSSHAFRHSFAMRCAELGMAIDDVQKLMGHRQRKSTEIYFKIKGKRLDDAMKKWDV